ncbi:MAG: hypothetical protein ACD_75C01056G0001 [uncultured bacterium]|nr:MAG: hypothetical protein ACD_75C01056G0001 [uncultured bacterium]
MIDNRTDMTLDDFADPLQGRFLKGIASRRSVEFIDGEKPGKGNKDILPGGDVGSPRPLHGNIFQQLTQQLDARVDIVHGIQQMRKVEHRVSGFDHGGVVAVQEIARIAFIRKK